MLTYKTYTPSELLVLTQCIPTSKNNLGSVFDGFTIFTAETLSNGYPDRMFFTCLDGDKLVGILKLTRVPRYRQNVWSISIVDVHMDYRRRGIARELHKCVNNFVTSDMVIVWTNLTDEGKAANIAKMGMSIINKCDTLENIDHFEEAYGYMYI